MSIDLAERHLFSQGLRQDAILCHHVWMGITFLCESDFDEIRQRKTWSAYSKATTAPILLLQTGLKKRARHLRELTPYPTHVSRRRPRPVS